MVTGMVVATSIAIALAVVVLGPGGKGHSESGKKGQFQPG